MASRVKSSMTSMVLGDSTLVESLTPSVNTPIILKVHKSLHIMGPVLFIHLLLLLFEGTESSSRDTVNSL